MGFLRRLFSGERAARADPPADSDADPAPPADPGSADAEERARDLELLREEQERHDDLTRRQLRYAEYAWEPPAQGGERRADDTDRGGDG
jgi:hypothetical protein